MKVLPVTFKNNQTKQNYNTYPTNQNNFAKTNNLNSFNPQVQPVFTGLFNWLNVFKKSPNFLTNSQAKNFLKNSGIIDNKQIEDIISTTKFVDESFSRYNDKRILEKILQLTQKGIKLKDITKNACLYENFFDFAKSIEAAGDLGYPNEYLRYFLKAALSVDDATNLINLRKIAQEKRELLSYNDDIISDDDIDRLLLDYPTKTIKALKVMGQKDFVNSFAQKYDEVCNNLSIIGKLDNYCPEFQDLLKLTNPTASDEYIKNQKLIKSLKVKFSPNDDNLKKQINDLTTQNRNLTGDSLKNWEDKLDLIYIFTELHHNNNILLQDILKIAKSKTKSSKNHLNRLLNKYITIDSTGERCTKLNFTDNKYLKKLFSASNDFGYNFQFFLKKLNDSTYEKPIDIFNNMEMNKETNRQFKKLQISYPDWVKFNPHSNIQKIITIGGEKQKTNLIKSLENDLNDDILEYIPQKEMDYLKNAMQKKGYTMHKQIARRIMLNGEEVGQVVTKHLYKDGEPIKFEDVPRFIRTLNKIMEGRNFWQKPNVDEFAEDAKEVFKAHLSRRLKEFLSINPKDKVKPVDITVQKADMNNVEHALFLGNHAGCCTAIGSSCNDWSAPAYIISKMISAIEIKAGDEFVGNTMCYIVEIDGKPALILDNIELKNKYQYEDEIRDMIFKYAKKLTEEIKRPDMRIYAGPNRHKVNMNDLPLENKNFRIIGSSDDWEMYFDFDTDFHSIDGKEIFESKLYRVY